MRPTANEIVFGLMALSAAHVTVALADNPTQVAGLNSTWAKCASLRNITIPASEIGMPTRGAVVTQTKLVPARATNPFGEYCLVDGEIAPLDSQAQKIKFSVAMPTQWNGKMVHFGGGAFNGEVVSPLGLGSGPGGSDSSFVTTPPPPLARGYITFGSDSGHAAAVSPGASFALNEEQLRNFGGEQLKKTRDAVMFLVKTRYGVVPTYSYFLGGGGGGRESYAVIQQYPEDYDGVVAMYPDVDMTATLLKMQVISRDMWLNSGAGWISRAKSDFLHRTELAACDKLDNLEDFIISNVDACRIDFDNLRCPDGKDTGSECFSDAQLKTLRDIHSPIKLPYVLANGETSLPASRIGTDWGASRHMVGTSWDAPPTSIADIAYFAAADTFVRYALLGGRKDADTLTFDPLKPGSILPRIHKVASFLARTSVDIDRFIGKSGKWIVVNGQTEEIFTPTANVNYHQRLVAKYGQAQIDKVLRFYLVPGHGHFNAAAGPTLDALENWVERGIAPETLTVVDESPEGLGRSRPMCVYPSWPKYSGVGDPNLASSFSCAVNQ